MRQPELIQVVQQLSSCKQSDDIMGVLRTAARDLTGADGVSVVLREGDYCHYVEENAIAPLWKGRRFPMDSCVSGWAMLNRASVAIPDIYADARVPQDAYRPTFVKSLAMVPIRVQDPIGAIGAYWATPHAASPGELAVLHALGESAALAFANVKLIASLQDAAQRKDELLAMLAHELRNPLAPIRNALHVMRRDASDPRTVTWAGDMMERQVAQLARIVDGLLDVARLNGGKVMLRRQTLDLGELLTQVLNERRGHFEAARLTLRTELGTHAVTTSGDQTRLAQIFGNVVDNAIKFTPPGGAISVRLLADAHGRAVVTMRDNGIGIAPAMLPHVFEVFAQADRSLERTRGGLGLGLSIAKSLLSLHGGTIDVASAGEGTGTEVTIRLPRSAEVAAPPFPQPETARKGDKSKHLKVLVVEDNRDAADSLRMVLESCGYDVTVAYDGKQGVAAARATDPDVVLCDIGLPEMNGFAVADALRSDPDTAAARLIAISGYSEDADLQRSAEAGFDAHMTKPVDPERLLRQLALLKGHIH